MIELNVKGHNEMCGGYAYSGHATFEGRTVKDVLQEIREFSKNEQAQYLGDGFGNPNIEQTGNCWKIRVNNKTYLSGWLNDNIIEYRHEDDEKEVEMITVNGGWYCFYDFDIYTKDFKKTQDENFRSKVRKAVESCKNCK